MKDSILSHMHIIKQFSFLFFLLIPFHTQVFAQAADSHQNLGKDKLVLYGYDVVEYFNDTAVKGKPKFQVIFQESKYRFSSLKNKILFKENPEKYLAQYGGWCAYAMGNNGEKVPVDPESFIVENGKLYLFYKSFFNDTKSKWTENSLALKEKANYNWNKLLKSKDHENKN